jgi:hypothetical protein
MTKEQLADSIEQAIAKLVEEFVDQPSPEAKKAQARFDELESDKRKVLQALDEANPAAKAAVSAIESEQQQLDTEDRKSLQNNRRHAAWAMVHAANNLRLPVMLKKTARTPATSNGNASHRRIPAKDIEAAAEKVLKSLPPQSTPDERCFDLATITDDTELEKSVVRSALGKLKRDGRAESNGKRGMAGGWRKAS